MNEILEQVQNGDFDPVKMFTGNKDKFLEVKTAIESISNNLPKELCKNVFLTKIIPTIFDLEIDNEVRDEVVEIGFHFLQFVNVSVLSAKEQEEIFNLIEETYTKVIGELRDKSYPNWDKLWIFLVKLCSEKLHTKLSLANKLLRIVEVAFRNSISIEQRLKAYDCWVELINNTSLNMEHMSSAKQIKLLVTPMKAKFSRMPIVIMKRCDTFLYLLEKLQDKATLCLKEFLEFCFGPFEEKNDEKMKQGRSVPEVCNKSTKVLLEILGHSHDRVDNCLESNDIRLFKPLINNDNFPMFSEILINSVVQCCILLHEWSQDASRNSTIVKCLWRSLLHLVHQSSDDIKKKCCLQINYALRKLLEKTDNSKSLHVVLGTIIDLLVQDKLIERFKEIVFDIAMNILRHVDIDSCTFSVDNISNFIKSCFDPENGSKFDKIASNFFKNSKCRNSVIFCDIWLNCKITVASDNVSNVIWPVHHLENFKDIKALNSKWTKLINIESKTDMKIILIQEMQKLFTENPLLSANIIQFLQLMSATEVSPSKDFVTKLLRLIELILTLPTVANSDLKKLTSLVLTYCNQNQYFYKSDNNDDCLDKLCSCIEQLVTIHKEYSVLTELAMLLENGQPKILAKFCKRLMSFLEAVMLNEDNSAISGTRKLIEVLETNENERETITLPSNRSMRIMSLTNITPQKNKKTAVQTNDLKYFGKSPKVESRRTFCSSQGKSDFNKKKSTFTSINDEKSSDFVKIDTEVKINLNNLNEHQIEILKKRREDIPALYNDLTQSQSQDFFKDSEVRQKEELPEPSKKEDTLKEEELLKKEESPEKSASPKKEEEPFKETEPSKEESVAEVANEETAVKKVKTSPSRKRKREDSDGSEEQPSKTRVLSSEEKVAKETQEANTETQILGSLDEDFTKMNEEVQSIVGKDLNLDGNKKSEDVSMNNLENKDSKANIGDEEENGRQDLGENSDDEQSTKGGGPKRSAETPEQRAKRYERLRKVRLQKLERKKEQKAITARKRHSRTVSQNAVNESTDENSKETDDSNSVKAEDGKPIDRVRRRRTKITLIDTEENSNENMEEIDDSTDKLYKPYQNEVKKTLRKSIRTIKIPEKAAEVVLNRKRRSSTGNVQSSQDEFKTNLDEPLEQPKIEKKERRMRKPRSEQEKTVAREYDANETVEELLARVDDRTKEKKKSDETRDSTIQKLITWKLADLQDGNQNEISLKPKDEIKTNKRKMNKPIKNNASKGRTRVPLQLPIQVEDHKPSSENTEDVYEFKGEEDDDEFEDVSEDSKRLGKKKKRKVFSRNDYSRHRRRKTKKEVSFHVTADSSNASSLSKSQTLRTVSSPQKSETITILLTRCPFDDLVETKENPQNNFDETKVSSKRKHRPRESQERNSEDLIESSQVSPVDINKKIHSTSRRKSPLKQQSIIEGMKALEESPKRVTRSSGRSKDEDDESLTPDLPKKLENNVSVSMTVQTITSRRLSFTESSTQEIEPAKHRQRSKSLDKYDLGPTQLTFSSELFSKEHKTPSPPVNLTSADTLTLDSTTKETSLTETQQIQQADTLTLSPVKPQTKDDLPSSPITCETPDRTTELLNSTSDISPISSDPKEEVSTPVVKQTSEVPNVRVARLLQMVNSNVQVSNSGSRWFGNKHSSSPSSSNKRRTRKIRKEEKFDILTFSREVPSPLTIPVSGILKRKINNLDDVATPSPKRKRVNFSDPAITEKKIFIKDSEDYEDDQNLDSTNEHRTSPDVKEEENEETDKQNENPSALDREDMLLSFKDFCDDKFKGSEGKSALKCVVENLKIPEIVEVFSDFLANSDSQTIEEINTALTESGASQQVVDKFMLPLVQKVDNFDHFFPVLFDVVNKLPDDKLQKLVKEIGNISEGSHIKNDGKEDFTHKQIEDHILTLDCDKMNDLIKTYISKLEDQKRNHFLADLMALASSELPANKEFVNCHVNILNSFVKKMTD